MEGIGRGEIKRLLVLEQLPKPVQSPGGRTLDDRGPFALARILAPCRRSRRLGLTWKCRLSRALLCGLDENGLAVKRMHSFASVMPGETMGCVGCHEHRTNAPPSANCLSQCCGRPPRSNRWPACRDVFDYPRDIQPILDRHCVACHNAIVGKARLT
jgi:hypothetical protein